MTEDDVPTLSAETLKALQEFLQEQAAQQDDTIKEDWQLSQFWYDESTTKTLSQAVLSLSNKSNIALLSCPTLYPSIKSNLQENSNVVLFEYDKKFSIYDPDFVYYDYNNPTDIDNKYQNYFDVIVMDPPFLSEECLSKTAQTVEVLRKPESKIMICTGAVMEKQAERLLGVRKCLFEPKHKNNLANEFICMTNFGEVQMTVNS